MHATSMSIDRLGHAYPAEQLVQLPVTLFAYVPRRHCVQPVLVEFATCPVLQEEHELAFAREYMFHGHVVHATDPAVLYVPAAQVTQAVLKLAPAFALYEPAGHGCGIVKFPGQ